MATKAGDGDLRAVRLAAQALVDVVTWAFLPGWKLLLGLRPSLLVLSSPLGGITFRALDAADDAPKESPQQGADVIVCGVFLRQCLVDLGLDLRDLSPSHADHLLENRIERFRRMHRFVLLHRSVELDQTHGSRGMRM